MYTPSAFAESRPEVLCALLRQHPLASLVSHGPEGLEAAHLPLLYFPEQGVLRGHMARANRQWEAMTASGEVLAIFNGPQHYISPNWYPSKQEHGQVVPTWNYVAIHVHGVATVTHDQAWLIENVRALTDAQEAAQQHPWKVDDAPADYIEGLARAIVGIEVKITRLEGKWKVSQNRSVEDRAGVSAGLAQLGTAEALAMGELCVRHAADTGIR